MRAIQVELHVPEPVDRDHGRVDTRGADLGLREVEPRECVGGDRRTELRKLDAESKVRRSRREQIAPVKRARDRLERVFRIRELVGDVDAAELLRSRDQQAVVRADVDATRPVAQSERAARAAHARIDDGEVHTRRHERQRVRERERTLQHALRRNPVRDVDDLGIRRDPLDHAVARADEIVLQAEIGQERDEGRHAAAESTSPRRACDSASAATSTPRRRAAPAAGGPLEIAGPRPPARAYARAADGDASSTRSARASSATSSSRVRYAGTKSASNSSTRWARAPSAPTKSTRPAGFGNSATRPSCVWTPETRSADQPPASSASPVPAPIAATRSGRRSARRTSSRAPLTLVTTTQS